MLAVIDKVSPEDWAQECFEKKVSAVNALVELVDGPSLDEKPHLIIDAAAWVHIAFYTYRSGMSDDDPYLSLLARIEHDVILPWSR